MAPRYGDLYGNSRLIVALGCNSTVIISVTTVPCFGACKASLSGVGLSVL